MLSVLIRGFPRKNAAGSGVRVVARRSHSHVQTRLREALIAALDEARARRA